MQRDIWLDNIINLRQYILLQTRSHYVTLLFIGWQVNICRWQVVLCSWQPLDVGATLSLSSWSNIVNSELEWVLTKFKIFIVAYGMCCSKTKFPTAYQTICLHKWIFWIKLSPKSYLSVQMFKIKLVCFRNGVWSTILSRTEKNWNKHFMIGNTNWPVSTARRITRRRRESSC